MKQFNFILLFVIITNSIMAQGVTKNGQSTGISTNFVTKNGQISTTPALTDNGQILSLPILTTTAVSSITNNSATSGGNITYGGGSLVTARGVCWSTLANPTIADNITTNGTGIGIFTSSITSLSLGVTYYVRAYATNSLGTGYGSQVSFATHPYGLVYDIDGNRYDTITIGTQVWMMENLKVSRYNNGDSITKVSNASTWSGMSTGAYCFYNNMAADTSIYGLLYNWYAATDSRLIAPAGWHVPTNAEWTTLINHLGGLSTAGGPLKETGITHWANPNTGATNSSWFTALPGGYRDNTGAYSDITQDGNFWTTTAFDSSDSYYIYLTYSNASISQNNFYNTLGLSVRCLKN